MPLPGLTIIGERINPGFASSKALLDAKDLTGLAELARSQVQKGAQYLTLNSGEAPEKDPDFQIALTRAIQEAVDVPISFDSPNPRVQEIYLKTYNPAKAGGRKPLINSIAQTRWDMMELLNIQPAKVVFMASERVENGQAVANKTAADVHRTARAMVEAARKAPYSLANDDIFIDVSVGPIATDSEGLTKMAVESIRLIGQDPDLKGVHIVVGLSNLSVMLPKEATDGSPLKVHMESAFLTVTMPLGLDTILGTPGRKYEVLPDSSLVLQGFREAIELEEYDTIIRVKDLYRARKPVAAAA